jgi:phospho-2-dehydro-3-deoxyheptonate aldolase
MLVESLATRNHNTTPHLPAQLELVETPLELEAMHPLDPNAELLIAQHRQTVIDIREGRDPRLMVWARPCSLDDSVQPDGTPSALAFTNRIARLRDNPVIAKALFVGTGMYPVKPRTGGTGKDDFAGLDQRNLVKAHELVTAGANMGVPLRTEVMTKEHIARYGSRVTVLQVGARDVGSTMLRRSLSATDIPVVCKNADSGNLDPAYRAMSTISTGHSGVEVTLPDGRTARYADRTAGNPHVIFGYRGGDDAMTPAAYERKVKEVAQRGLPYELDNAHGPAAAHDPNGKKSVEGQIAAFEHNLRLMHTAGQLATQPVSLLLEAYLLGGADTTEQTPGMSWTDPGISIGTTEEMILELARVHGKILDRA